MRLRWLWSLLLWSLLTTSAIAVSGLAASDAPGGDETARTAPSLPGDRAVYKSALVVVEGNEGQWFDLNARYAFERLDDRLLAQADALVPVRSFVHEWVVEPFEFTLLDFLFLDFPSCLTDLTGIPMEAMMDPGAYDTYDYGSADSYEWAMDFTMEDMEACIEDVESWAEGVEATVEPYFERFEAWDDEVHTVQASEWHVSHVDPDGEVVASTWRNRPGTYLVPDLDGAAWTLAETSEAPCGFQHGLQDGPRNVWAPILVHGACPPAMDFGFAATAPLEGPVRMQVSGEDRVDSRSTLVYAHADNPERLRLWFADDLAYPVRILSEVDVVPPAWLPYANNGHPPRFYILQELIESDPGAPGPDLVATPLPPATGIRHPWGPSDAGTGHPWPLSQAYLETARAPDSAFGAWLLDHPGFAMDQATYLPGPSWHMTFISGTSAIEVVTTQGHTGDATTRTFNATGRPDASEQPTTMPSIRSLMARHEAQGGDTTAYRFAATCPRSCADPAIAVAVGQHPKFGDSRADLSLFDGDGQPMGRVQAPDPYPDPRFADRAWSPDHEDAWAWGVATQGGVWTWPEPKTAAGVAAATGLVSLLYLLWPLAKGAGALPLFSRIRSEDLLQHPVRNDLYEVVTKRPGIHFQEIARHLDKGRGTTEHHLRKLVQAGLLVEKADSGFTCYFPKGAVDRKLMAAAPVLKTAGARNVLAAVHASPGAVAADLSARLGMPTSTVNYHLKKLVNAGLVDTTRQGRSLALHATTLGDQALGTFQT